ncbi:hypothetical protein VPH184E373B_0127 [Vibrio phage 184E37-3b]
MEVTLIINPSVYLEKFPTSERDRENKYYNDSR